MSASLNSTASGRHLALLTTCLRSWILSRAHMQNVRHDDFILRFFLRGCNYRVTEAKDKLDLYFSAR